MIDFALQPRVGRQSRFAIIHASGDLRVVAIAPFVAGECILTIEGRLVTRPSRYSIQIDEGLHLDIPTNNGDQDLAKLLSRYPWCFLNHSCTPNAYVRGRELLALRDLRPWEEVTFDYETTEWELADPFPCRCTHCEERQVRGFQYLSRAEREARRPRLAAHLLRLLGEPGN